jgi:hypothetical protein
VLQPQGVCYNSTAGAVGIGSFSWMPNSGGTSESPAGNLFLAGRGRRAASDAASASGGAEAGRLAAGTEDDEAADACDGDGDVFGLTHTILERRVYPGILRYTCGYTRGCPEKRDTQVW